MDEVEVAGRKVIVGTHGTMRVHIDLDVSSPYTAFVEVMSATNSVQEEAEKTDPEMPVVVEEKKLIIFDHHGPLSWKKSVSRQAFQWLKLRPEGEEVGEIVVEPPLDADQVTAVVQLVTGEPAPEEVVLGIDAEDRKSAVGLWDKIKSGHRELGAAIPVLEAVNKVNEERGGPWFSDDPEEFAEALVEALGRVYKVIEAIKDGDIDPEREAERWTEEFEEWAEKQCRDQDIIEELEIAGYRVVFAEAPPTALYVAKNADLAVSHGQGRVTIGISPISDLDVDLRELFKWLSKKHRQGWGGRPDVGGSPKDYTIDRKEFEETVIPLIKRWIREQLG